MAKFPKSESDIVVLAETVIAGLSANSTVYSMPPISIEQLTTRLQDYQAARNAAVAAQAAAEEATLAKDKALAALTKDLRTNLRYAENAVDYNDEQLKMLGWGGRSKRSPMRAPGQVRDLEAPRQGESWVLLNWKRPQNGGRVAAYKVQRRERDKNGAWMDLTIALTLETTLVDQPRSVVLEYRIIAINRAGESTPSNTVSVVL